MILQVAAIALLVQAPPVAQRPAGKATISGVVQTSTGEPLANVRVSLGKMNVNLGPFAQMVAGDRPPADITLPAEFLTLMGEEIAAAANVGDPQGGAEAAALAALPVADIYEITITRSGNITIIPKSSPPTLTDAQGRFAFTNVDPGTYKLMFSADGYAKQDFGQRTAAGSGTPLTLGPNDARTDIVMRLMSVGAVGGHIRDGAGQPVAGVPVELLRFLYDENGQRTMDRVAIAQSDDRGEYRMYYLPPGRYYLSAGGQTGTSPGIPLQIYASSRTPNQISQRYGLLYYPASADSGGARPIDIQPGADMPGIDMTLGPQLSYRVRGRVVDPRTGVPPQAVNISANVVARDVLSVMVESLPSGGNTNYRPTDGSFELQNVSPGTYTITANLPNRQPSQDLNSMTPAQRTEFFNAMNAAENARPKASTVVNVGSADLDNVILTLGTSGSISGRIREESNGTLAASLPFMRVQLRKEGASIPNPIDIDQQSPRQGPPKDDATLRIENVWPGDYRLFLGGLPPGFYLKAAKLGDTDVLNEPLRYTGAESGSLDILLSSKVASITGNATDAAGQPLPGAQVVLIPATRARTDLFKPALSDSSGRFTIADVAPGDYVLAAWDAIEPYAFFEPDRISEAERQGKTLRVAEASTQNVNVVAIPSAGR